MIFIKLLFLILLLGKVITNIESNVISIVVRIDILNILFNLLIY